MSSIQAENIQVSYDNRIIIDELSTSIPKGNITTIIGANGCGKSTLLKALTRIIPVQEGAIYLDGQAISQLPTKEVAKKLALLPQVLEATEGISVYELVSYGRFPHQNGLGHLTDQDREKINWALEVTQTAPYARLPVDDLSGGQRQRVWIAMALAQDTDTIFLDEPTTYLDLNHQLEALELLKELNQSRQKTIVMVLHDVNLSARFSDYMIAMKEGDIRYHGSVSNMMTTEILRDIFSIEPQLMQVAGQDYPILLTYDLKKNNKEKKMKKFLAIFSLFVGLVFLTACSTSSSSTEVELSSMPKIEGITYHGDIPKNPKKVVNFAYSYTGYLLQLGIDVSSYSLDLEKNSPAFGDKLKDVPQLTTADTEAIAAQKPDVILVFAGDDNLETLKEIAPVIEITYGKSDYLKMLTDVGQIFGKEKEAQAWLDQWDKKVATAKEELKGLIDTSSTFTVMDFFDKNIFLYGNNFGRGGELVYRALGFAAPAKVQEDIINKEGWFGVSQEALPEYVGDYVLVNVNDKTKEAAASLKESDIWKNLPAVKNGHVIEVDYNLFYFSDPMSLDLQIDAFVSAIQKLQ